MTTKENEEMCEIEFRHKVRAHVGGWDFTIGETHIRTKCKTKEDCLEVMDRFLPRTALVADELKKAIKKKEKKKK